MPTSTSTEATSERPSPPSSSPPEPTSSKSATKRLRPGSERSSGKGRPLLSVAKAASSGYYAGFAHGDYYLEGGEPLGLWLGEGAKVFGLKGTVDRDQFIGLADGYHPTTGDSLVQNAGKDSRQIGWDLTFSAPKTVSVAWALSDKETREAIQAAQFQAVSAAFSYLQQQAGFTRTGKGGAQTTRALLTGAAFEHGTSRAQDPQLHTHLFLVNVGIGTDGKTRTLKTEELYRHKMAAGAVYRAELAHGLHQLGFDPIRHSHHDPEKRRTHSWFELAGIPQDLVEHFSKRRQDVLAAMEGRGSQSAEASKIAALATRAKKEHLPRQENLERWKEEARGLGFELSKAQLRELGDTKRDEKELLDRIHDRLSTRESFTERDLVRRLAIEAQDHGKLSGEACVAAAQEALRSDPRFYRFVENEGEEQRYSTRAYKLTERKIREQLERAEKERSFSFSAKDLDRQTAKHELTDEERRQVETATTRGRVATVETMSEKGIEATRELYERAGYRVLVLGTSKERTDELQKTLGDKAAASAYSLLWQHRSHAPTLRAFFLELSAKTALRSALDAFWKRTPAFAKDEARSAFLSAALRATGRISEKQHRWDELMRNLPSELETGALHDGGFISEGQKKYLDWQRERQHLHLDKKTVLLVDQGERLNAERTRELLELAEKHRAKLILSDTDRHRPHHEAEREIREESREEELEELQRREEEARILREQEKKHDMELSR